MNQGVTLKFGRNGQPELPEVKAWLGDDCTLYGLARAVEDELSHHNLVEGRVKVRARLGMGYHGGLILSTEDKPGNVEVEFELRDVGYEKYLPHVNPSAEK